MKVYVIQKWMGDVFDIYDVTASEELANIYKYNPDFEVTEWMVK